MRHKNNKKYVDFLEHTKAKEKFNSIINHIGETSVFNKGLFASSEMLVNGFLDLHKHDILKKSVYDDVILQKLLNENQITEQVTPNTIDLLLSHKKITPLLTKNDFDYLQLYGIFKDKQSLQYHEGYIYYSQKNKVIADLTDTQSKTIILNNCLGDKLKNGHILHAGFFIGSRELYEYLNNLCIDERKQFDMRSIMTINQLYHHPDRIDTLQRINARFINTSMKVTLLGSVTSDTLENAQVISGVGGQYNFIAMSHELDDARSIINCKSTYTKNGKTESNIIWNYAETTIPRHLRDIIVTEYGIADCRSKTDSEVIKELLNITDSRFQEKLMSIAKKYGKLPSDYNIPKIYRFNLPETISNFINLYHDQAIYKRYPFGTELTTEEIQLEISLKYIKSLSTKNRILLILKGVFISNNPYKKLLLRMKLNKPKKIKEYIYRFLLISVFNNLKLGN